MFIGVTSHLANQFSFFPFNNCYITLSVSALHTVCTSFYLFIYLYLPPIPKSVLVSITTKKRMQEKIRTRKEKCLFVPFNPQFTKQKAVRCGISSSFGFIHFLAKRSKQSLHNPPPPVLLSDTISSTWSTITVSEKYLTLLIKVYVSYTMYPLQPISSFLHTFYHCILLYSFLNLPSQYFLRCHFIYSFRNN